MKTASATLTSYLNSFPNALLMADAFQFTLVDGSTLAYTNAQIGFTNAGVTYLPVGPLLQRSSIRQVAGVEVDTLDVQVMDDGSTPVRARAFVAAIRDGLLDGATLYLRRVFFSAPGVLVDPVDSSVILFAGTVGALEVGRYQATIRCNSLLAMLNQQVPRNQYQPGCLNTLYDAGCGLAKAAFSSTFAVTAGNSASQFFYNSSKPQDYHTQGVITFTSGACAGVSRTVRQDTATQLIAVAPFPAVPATGDTFTVRPGCDKSQATCTTKFNNLTRFRGFPYVPVVTSVVAY